MSNLSIEELSSDIRSAIENLKNDQKLKNVGIVTRVGDGIAWIYGLSDCSYNEMLEINGHDGRFFRFSMALRISLDNSSIDKFDTFKSFSV